MNGQHTHIPNTAILVAVLVLLIPARFAEAQGASSATLRGTVLDASGSVLPGAKLILTSARTLAVRTATSNSIGGYAFPMLTPGPYRLRAERPGFAPWESGELHLSLGDSLVLDATLAVGALTDEVTVTAERPMLRQDHGAREGLITSQQIEELSIISRSATELLRIVPGALVPDQSQASMEVVAFGVGANDLQGYSVNGSRGHAFSPVLDGAKVLDIGSSASMMLNINTDMVEEVKIQAGNYAAEYGSSPVQLSALTKGGSGSFHGSVYDYWRNWRLAANDRSNNYARNRANDPSSSSAGDAANQYVGLRPKSDYQYPGFNLSGPVMIPGTDLNKKRDTLFFFVGFELQRQTIDQGTSLTVVPTLAQRQGDFSELLSGRGQNLAQPPAVRIPWGFSGAGQPAPNNDLSPYIDPIGQAYLNTYPLPNYDDPENRYNYAFNELRPLNRWQLTTRLDWNVSESTRAYVRLALEREETKWARGAWDCCANVPLPSRVVGDNQAWSVSTNVTSVLSPTLTNEVVIAASRLELDTHWEDPASASSAALGLEGFEGVFPSTSPDAPMDIVAAGLPMARLRALSLPLYAHNDSVSFADNMTKVVGMHTIKLGVFAERGRKQQNFPTQSMIVLGSPFTAGGTGNDYGDLLVGRMFRYLQGTEVPGGEFRFWNLEGYLQDSWKVSRSLTLEAGLRLSKMPNNEELTGLAIRFEPSAYDPTQGVFIDGDPQRPNGVLLASRGEIPNGITESPGVKLMPRFNFAWDVKGDAATILRGGVGLFYRRPPGNDEYQVIGQPPNAFNADIYWWDVPGGLTLSSLPSIDPWSRLSASSISSRDPRSIHLPQTWNWSLGVARRLPWQQTLEVAYVGSRSDYLPNQTDGNYIPPGTMTGMLDNADLDNPLHRAALDGGVAATLRSYPAYSRLVWFQYEAWARHDSLQVTLSRAGSGRVQYVLAYTFGRTRGNPGHDQTSIDPINPENRSTGVVYQDRPHIFNASWSWTLPDPISADGNAVLRGLLNGWQLSGITNYASGIPDRVYFTGAIAEPNMQRAWWGTDGHQSGSWGNAGHVTPVFQGDPTLDNTGVEEPVLDIVRIGIPALGESGPFQPSFDFRYPTRWNWDLTLMKNFPLGGEKRLQLRVGVFNIFNQALPSRFSGDIDLDLRTECNVRVNGVPNGAGGIVGNVCDPSQGFHFTELTRENFGRILTKRGHRVIELAAKLMF